MTGTFASPTAAVLPGARLHLHHGPIDLVIGADGEDPAVRTALVAAQARFRTILGELVAELDALRRPVSPATTPFEGPVARRMHRACLPHAARWLTAMAAVAGAVADEILAAMTQAAVLSRAWVNNGGDIAVHIRPGREFSAAMALHDGSPLGRLVIRPGDGIGGIATSSRHGRSQSLGIADSVTVLARDAASADAAATLIANAVDLPGHPAVRRVPAVSVKADSDLGARLVTVDCGPLSSSDVSRALDSGLAVAEEMRATGLIAGAALFLAGDSRVAGEGFDLVSSRSPLHA